MSNNNILHRSLMAASMEQGVPVSDYLGIEPLYGPIMVSFTNDIEYLVISSSVTTIDNDEVWATLLANSSRQIMPSQKMLIKASIVPNNSSGVGTFTLTGSNDSARCEVGGNCLSLVYGDNASGQSAPAYSFRYLFQNCKTLQRAKDDLLPATSVGAYGYYRMFSGCNYLINAPVLPATQLGGSSVYEGMFENCSSLMLAQDELPALSVPSYGYQSMFLGCTSLISSPRLPAHTVWGYGYKRMFEGCTSLASAPELPATLLGTQAYAFMFYNCFNLIDAPSELPAINLADECYRSMFSGCSTMAYAPSLPATTLKASCYTYMFSYCTAIVEAPALPAPSLVENCYVRMFFNCTSLERVEALFVTDPSSGSYATDWLYGVATSGTFIKRKSATWDETATSYIPSGWDIEEKNLDTIYDCNYCVLLPLEDGLTYTCEYNSEYSRNKGQTWTSLAYNKTSPSFKACEEVWLRGTMDWNTSPHGSPFMGTFSASKKFEMYGNGMALQYGDNATSSAAQTSKKLSQFFYNCETLLYVSENFLPAKTLVKESYKGMFNGCTSLVYGPDIRPTAISEGCCSGMFSGCSSLKRASRVLPATTLYTRCYASMYRYCSKLIEAPELPSLNLVSECYSQLFSDCRKLNRIKAMFVSPTPSSSYSNLWVDGVASSGTFIKNKNATWDVVGWHGVPNGWTIQLE